MEDKDVMDPRDHLDSWVIPEAVQFMQQEKRELLEVSPCIICEASLGEAVPTPKDSTIECTFCGTPYVMTFPDGTFDSLELRSPYSNKELLEAVQELWREAKSKQEFEEKAVTLLANWAKNHD